MQLERFGLGDLHLAGQPGPSGEHLCDDVGQRREGVVVAGRQDEAVEGDVVVEVGGDIAGGALGTDSSRQCQQPGALALGGPPGRRRGGDRLDGCAQFGQSSELRTVRIGLELPTHELGCQSRPVLARLNHDAYSTSRGDDAHRFQGMDAVARQRPGDAVLGLDRLQRQALPRRHLPGHDGASEGVEDVATSVSGGHRRAFRGRCKMSA